MKYCIACSYNCVQISVGVCR